VMRGDARSYRIAVVPDDQLPELLDVLEEQEWGTIQLPPAEVDVATAQLWLEQVAEHVAEFVRNDYAVVLVEGDPRADEFVRALGELGVSPLPTVAGDSVSLREAQYAIQPPSTSRLTPET
jgi:hypothetical protein